MPRLLAWQSVAFLSKKTGFVMGTGHITGFTRGANDCIGGAIHLLLNVSRLRRYVQKDHENRNHH
jgi:hypothetical protein